MPDISELIIEVKQINKTLSDIDRVGKKLKQTGADATTLGKTILAGWSFTKIIQGAKAFGDAWRDVSVSFKTFDSVFGKWNKNAQAGVEELMLKFHDTEAQAKKLLSRIAGRINIDFEFNEDTVTEVSKKLAMISKDIGAAFGRNTEDVALKLNNALNGSTKGLREFGVAIDTSSPKFKQLVEEMMNAKGYTEESAKAMVIYNEILRKTKRFSGSFDAQAKGLSQAMEDLSNTLNTGVFAKAGEVLSSIFVPILERINDVLSKPWVQSIMGIVAALGLVIASLVTISALMGKIGTMITTAAAGAGIKAAFAGVLTSIGVMMKGIFIAIGKAILVGVSAVVTFIAGLPAAAIAAIIAVLAAGAVLLVNKLTTGEWFNFSGMVDAVIGWFKSLSEKIVNWFKGEGFKDNQEKQKEIVESLRKRIDKVNQILEKTDEEIDAWAKEQADAAKAPLQRAREHLEEANKRRGQAKADFKNWEKSYNEWAAKLKEQAQTGVPSKEVQDAYQRAAEQRDSAWKRFKKADEDYKKAKEEEARLVEEEARVAKEAADAAAKLKEEKRKSVLAFASTKFGDFTWYQDAMKRIQEGLGKSLSKDKIKDLDDRINEFKKAFNGLSLTPEEARTKYKELSNLELQKFQAEMDALNKEREFIKSTNELIEDYVQKAMEWTAQGVEGIQANTAEGYKFMTSGLGDLSSLGPVLKDANTQQTELQKKANDIASKTKASIDDIKRKIDSLPTNTNPITINVIN